MSEPRYNKSKTTTSGAFTVGQIAAPEFLWSGLAMISKAPFTRNGVFIIYSGSAGGRIGIFSNRYITGAVADGTGTTGQEALKSLLSVEAGIFGFRPCLGNESHELRQQLTIDLVEILSARETVGRGMTPAEAIKSIVTGDGSTQKVHFAEGPDYLFDPTIATPTEGEKLLHLSEPLTQPIDLESAPSNDRKKYNLDPDPTGYLEWVAALAHHADLPKLKEVLVIAMNASDAPAADQDSLLSTPEATKAYHDGVLEESKRLEQQLAQLETGTPDSNVGDKPLNHFAKSDEDRAKLAENLKLLNGMLKQEETRARGWLASQLKTTLKPKNLMTLTGLPTLRAMAAAQAEAEAAGADTAGIEAKVAQVKTTPVDETLVKPAMPATAPAAPAVNEVSKPAGVSTETKVFIAFVLLVVVAILYYILIYAR